MKFTDLQRMFSAGDLTEDVLLEQNVSSGDFLKMRQDSQSFETAGYAAEPGKVRDRVYNYAFVTESAIGYFKDVPLATGWNLKEYRARRSPILFGHDSRNIPIGRGLTVQRNKDFQGLKAMLGQVEFAPEGISDQVDLVEGMVGAGILNGGSVGFDIKEMREPTKDEIKKYKLGKYSTIFTKMDLIEYSVVPLGRDPKAGVIYTEKGAAAFEVWLAENSDRYSEDSVREVRETILCKPTSKSFHSLRTWAEASGDWSDEAADDVAVVEVAMSDELQGRLTALEATVQQLNERLDGPTETEEEDEEGTMFGLPIGRVTEILEGELNQPSATPGV